MSAARSGSSTRLPLLPDVVDLGVVGDRLQRDVRHALVDEALADIVVGRRVGGGVAGELGFLRAALAAVGEQIPRIARRHQARAGERQRDAAGVDRDPAPAPLLGDIGGGARAAGRIEHEVAGVGGHQDAALDDLRGCLNDIDFRIGESALPVSSTILSMWIDRKVIEVSNDSESVLPAAINSICRLASRFRPRVFVFQRALPGTNVASLEIEARYDRRCPALVLGQTIVPE